MSAFVHKQRRCVICHYSTCSALVNALIVAAVRKSRSAALNRGAVSVPNPAASKAAIVRPAATPAVSSSIAAVKCSAVCAPNRETIMRKVVLSRTTTTAVCKHARGIAYAKIGHLSQGGDLFFVHIFLNKLEQLIVYNMLYATGITLRQLRRRTHIGEQLCQGFMPFVYMHRLFFAFFGK